MVRQDLSSKRQISVFREFTKGGLVKGGLAIDVFPLCNCSILGSVVNV